MLRSRGKGLLIAVVAVATTALWISFGIRTALEANLRELVARVGADLFYVTKRSRELFAAEELRAVAQLEEVAPVAGEGIQRTVSHPGQKYTLTSLEVTSEYPALLRLSLQAGRSFSQEDVGRRVAILGARVKEVLFGEEEAVGKRVEVGGYYYTVIGVLAPIPSEDGLRRKLNNLVLVPLTEQPWALFVRARGSVPRAQQAIGEVLPGVSFTTATQRYEIYFHLERVVSWLLLAIAGGLSLIAAVTAASIVSMDSLRRGWEIGVRRAVGATVPGIVRLFSGEVLWAASLGAAGGVGLGSLVSHLSPLFGWESRLGLLHLLVPLIPIVAGALASLYPSWRAARVPPARALGLRTLEAQRAFGLGVGKIAAATAVLVGTGALAFLAVFLFTVEAHLGGLWGDVDQRTLLVRAPRKSILPAPELTPGDLSRLRELPGVELVVVGAPRVLGAGMGVYGVGVGYTDLKLFSLVAGRDLTQEEISQGARVALVGKSFAEAQEEGALGESFRIRGQEFTVVGVFDDSMARFYLGVPAVVPYRSLEKVWLFHEFWVRVREGYSPQEVKEEIGSLFQRLYPERAPVEVISPGEELSQAREFTYKLATSLGAFAGLGFTAAASGMFNLMSFLLLLRLRELGIRRALGANRVDIIRLGVGEAGKVAVLAASLGGGVGTWGSALALERFHVEGPLRWGWAVAALALACACALAAGGWPARRAALLSPAKAIREGRR